jgi:Zn-dependent M28 family amino/carboxypeptidase
VIGTKTGTVDPDQQVIICGHFDSRSEQPQTNAPGADDNCSGTTAAIEAARVFADFNFEKTIKFCLWTGEEQGLYGSAAYAEEAYARGDDIIGVYNFDMIAWDGNGDGSVEFHTGTSGPSIELGNALDEVVSDYGIDLDPDIITFNATSASDHASFWEYGYAAMLGIEDYSSDFNPYYHTWPYRTQP